MSNAEKLKNLQDTRALTPVQIHWLDSMSDDRWISTDDTENHLSTCEVLTVGYLFQVQADYIVLSQSIADDHLQGQLSIPLNCIIGVSEVVPSQSLEIRQPKSWVNDPTVKDDETTDEDVEDWIDLKVAESPKEIEIVAEGPLYVFEITATGEILRDGSSIGYIRSDLTWHLHGKHVFSRSELVYMDRWTGVIRNHYGRVVAYSAIIELPNADPR